MPGPGSDAPQPWQHFARPDRLRSGSPETEIQVPVETVKLLIDGLSFRPGSDDAVAGAKCILGLFDAFENSGGEEGEDGRAETGDFLFRNQNWSLQDVGVNLVEYLILLWNPAPVDDPANGYSVFGHSVKNDAGVEGSALNGCKEFVSCRRSQTPAQRDSSKVGIDQDRTISVVPGQPQQAGLSRQVVFQSTGEFCHSCGGTSCDRFEEIASCRKPGLNAEKSG